MLPIVGLILFTLINSGNGASFSAVAKMNGLIGTEKIVIDIVKKYIRIEERRLIALKTIVEDYKSEHQKASFDTQAYLSNPVNAYLLLRHLTIDWARAKSLISKNENKSLLKKIAESKKVADFPTDEDLLGATRALLNLQKTYKLEIARVAEGFLGRERYGHRLSAEDCFQIGKLSFKMNKFQQAIGWMQQVWNLVEKRAESSVSKPEIAQYLAYSSFHQGNISLALDWTNKGLQYFPRSVKASINQLHYENAMKGGIIEETEITEEDFSEYDYEDAKYEDLCRGEILMSPEIQKQLKCRYVDHGKAFLKVAPFKEEEAFLDPRVVIYHDVISDKEIKVFKKLGSKVFEDSGVGDYVDFDVRLSNTGWIEYQSHDYVKTITQRMEQMTGLSRKNSETLQIANYGLGGFYLAHADYFEEGAFSYHVIERNTPDYSGNRIATVLFYMSDVELGGATVFPDLNVTLWPQKGSAVFWYNLKPDGAPNPMTMHGACPVLKGSKWVANKWIRESGQELLKPCPVRS